VAYVLAAAGAASAQSSVTLFGIVDLNFRNTNNGNGLSRSEMATDGYNSNRLGFRGTEDLGGGMSASFHIEGGMTPDNGTAGGLTFQRKSVVSLAGGWGEVRLGRDYTPNFYNTSAFDPFGTNGVGSAGNFAFVATREFSTFAIPATPVSGAVGATGGVLTMASPNAVRANNMVSYFIPGKLGGFYGQASYAFGEQTGANTPAGKLAGTVKGDQNYAGVRVGYANGPINVALGHGVTKYEVGNWKATNIGGSYDLGMAKLMGFWQRQAFGGAKSTDVLIGALVPVGAGEIRASFMRKDASGGVDGDANQFALGYVHNLSKRTALYTTYARIKNKGSAASGSAYNVGGVAATNGGSSNRGYEFGVRHAF